MAQKPENENQQPKSGHKLTGYVISGISAYQDYTFRKLMSMENTPNETMAERTQKVKTKTYDEQGNKYKTTQVYSDGKWSEVRTRSYKTTDHIRVKESTYRTDNGMGGQTVVGTSRTEKFKQPDHKRIEKTVEKDARGRIVQKETKTKEGHLFTKVKTREVRTKKGNVFSERKSAVSVKRITRDRTNNKTTVYKKNRILGISVTKERTRSDGITHTSRKIRFEGNALTGTVKKRAKKAVSKQNLKKKAILAGQVGKGAVKSLKNQVKQGASAPVDDLPQSEQGGGLAGKVAEPLKKYAAGTLLGKGTKKKILKQKDKVRRIQKRKGKLIKKNKKSANRIARISRKRPNSKLSKVRIGTSKILTKKRNWQIGAKNRRVAKKKAAMERILKRAKIFNRIKIAIGVLLVLVLIIGILPLGGSSGGGPNLSEGDERMPFYQEAWEEMDEDEMDADPGFMDTFIVYCYLDGMELDNIHKSAIMGALMYKNTSSGEFVIDGIRAKNVMAESYETGFGCWGGDRLTRLQILAEGERDAFDEDYEPIEDISVQLDFFEREFNREDGYRLRTWGPVEEANFLKETDLKRCTEQFYQNYLGRLIDPASQTSEYLYNDAKACFAEITGYVFPEAVHLPETASNIYAFLKSRNLDDIQIAPILGVMAHLSGGGTIDGIVATSTTGEGDDERVGIMGWTGKRKDDVLSYVNNKLEDSMDKQLMFLGMELAWRTGYKDGWISQAAKDKFYGYDRDDFETDEEAIKTITTNFIKFFVHNGMSQEEIDECIEIAQEAYELMGGSWVFPIQGATSAYRTSRFGDTTYHSGEASVGGHHGVDMRASTGEVLVSMGPGRVHEVGDDTGSGGRGKFVVIEYNASNDGGATHYYSLYQHMSRVDVSVGDVVMGGTPVGLAGGTYGYASHLHLEMSDCVSPVASGVYTNGVLNGWLFDPWDFMAVQGILPQNSAVDSVY